MEGDGTSGEAKSPDVPKFVKTLRIPGKRKCILLDLKPGFLASGGKVVDNGDCVDLVIEGKMVDRERYAWMAGPDFKAAMKFENGKHVVYTPPFISSFPKKEIDVIHAEQVLKKINLDLVDFMCLEMDKAGVSIDPQSLEKLRLDFAAGNYAGNKEEDDSAAAAAAGNKEELDEDAPNKEGEEAKKRKRGSKTIELDEDAPNKEGEEAKKRNRGSRPDEVK